MSQQDINRVLQNRKEGLNSRPLSPHIQIYRWPLSMALSILHRISGIALGFSTLLMTWWLLAIASSDVHFLEVQWFVGSALGLPLLFAWVLSLYFHLFSGLRHLTWDVGIGFESNTYSWSGWLVVTATVMATISTWIVGLAVW